MQEKHVQYLLATWHGWVRLLKLQVTQHKMERQGYATNRHGAREKGRIKMT